MGECDAKIVAELYEKIKPYLAGHEPMVQGAVLADLLATWLASHAPQIREDILDIHILGVKSLIKVNEKIIFGEAGHPAGRS